MPRWSLDLAKTRVVIIGVITGIRCGRFYTATNNAPRSSCTLAACPDGIFAVIAAVSGRKNSLPIAKYRAILVIPERTALINQCQHITRLRWQLIGGDAGNWVFLWPPGMHHNGAKANQSQTYHQPGRCTKSPTELEPIAQHEIPFLNSASTPGSVRFPGLTLIFQEA
jgi:hypothetical protein